MRNQKTGYPFSVWAALVAVYVIWGSTYLAIRFAIETIPPFLMAGTRFLTAGLLLYGFMRLKGVPRPQAVHWKSAVIVGFFLILVANGGVSWAERKVPSGIAALLVGTVPLWIALLQWVWKGESRPGWKIWAGIGLGLVGIILLVFAKGTSGETPADLFSALLLVGTSLAWAFGSLYARSCPLPSSALLATAMEMITGGILQLVLGLFLGEPTQFSWSALSSQSLHSWIYLTFIGSLVGFTSYIWVLQKATPALASTYAFVNPVIAVFLGWLLAKETLTPSIFIATALIVGAVVLITRVSKAPKKLISSPKPRDKRKISNASQPAKG
jgi:drug/metabolite transporter (DMT)-like permease